MATYGDCNTTVDAAVAAGAETLLADLTIPSARAGRIKKIRLSYGGVVDAKAATGFCELKLGNHSGPFRYPLGGGAGGATSSSMKNAEEIDVDIPVIENETVKLYVTIAENAVQAHGGIIWVSEDPA